MDIEFKDVNKVYTDAMNRTMSVSISPASLKVIGVVNYLSLVIRDVRSDRNVSMLISESEIPNIINQLENIKIYFENNKESK